MFMNRQQELMNNLSSYANKAKAKEKSENCAKAVKISTKKSAQTAKKSVHTSKTHKKPAQYKKQSQKTDSILITIYKILIICFFCIAFAAYFFSDELSLLNFFVGLFVAFFATLLFALPMSFVLDWNKPCGIHLSENDKSYYDDCDYSHSQYYDENDKDDEILPGLSSNTALVISFLSDLIDCDLLPDYDDDEY